MIWTEELVNQLYEGGIYRRTVHKGKIVYMRKDYSGEFIAIETPSGVFYAGQEYPERVKRPKDKVNWSNQLGNYRMGFDAQGRLVECRKIN